MSNWMANDMAFPVLDREQTPNGTIQPGLTKREYFAAMAMQGLAPHYTSGNNSMSSLVAKLAIENADALLAELAKPIETPLDTEGRPAK